MPKYQYKVIDAAGMDQTGTLAMTDIKAAAGVLRRRGLFVVALTEAEPDDFFAQESAASDRARDVSGKDAVVAPVSLRGLLGWLRPVRDPDRILFLRQGALMLRSGLTLTQCLDEAAQTTPKPRFAAALRRIQRSLQGGAPLSRAMREEGRLFPQIVVKMIEGAEASGEMDTVFDRMADYLERWAALRTAVLTSLAYPAIVVLVSVAVAGFLVLKVIPKFVQFFAARQTVLPWATQFLVDLSAWMTGHRVGLLMAFLIAIATWIVGRAVAPARRVVDRVIIALPVVGNLVQMGAMAHLGRTLSMLLGSGVTLIESLRIVRGLIQNRALADCLTAAAASILSGGDLAGGLRHGAIPRMVPQVVSVGERTGALSHVLEEIGQFYERQIHAATRRLSALVEPVLILIIGGMVGFVYFAFFQAVFQIATAGRR